MRWRKRPSLNEIERLLTVELEPQFVDLESDRKKAIWRLQLCFLVGLGLVGLFFYLLKVNPRLVSDLELTFGVAFAVEAFFVVGFYRAKKNFSLAFKEKVMRKVTGQFFPTLKYSPSGAVPKRFWDESELFRKELDKYEGNDFFEGKLGDVDFQFSELDCSYETGSGKNRRTVKVFRGFFFVGDFHREMFFRTQIRPDTAEKWLGVLGRGLQRVGSGSRLVDLEDPEFEKLFVVTSDDQVEARYILTPVFMEKIRDFRKRVGSEIHLSFVNGRMILAMESAHDYFEPNLFGKILNRRDLMEFIDILILILGVAEEFLHHPRFGHNRPKMPPLPNLRGK